MSHVKSFEEFLNESKGAKTYKVGATYTGTIVNVTNTDGWQERIVFQVDSKDGLTEFRVKPNATKILLKGPKGDLKGKSFSIDINKVKDFNDTFYQVVAPVILIDSKKLSVSEMTSNGISILVKKDEVKVG